MEPSVFMTGTIGEAKAELFTGFKMPCSISLFNCSSTFSFSAKGTFRALRNLGRASGLRCSDTFGPQHSPSPGLNTSANFSKS